MIGDGGEARGSKPSRNFIAELWDSLEFVYGGRGISVDSARRARGD